ncbi:lysozyme [Cyanophage S-2L]|nr:lysozyme [Cyanophage S-2L]
MTRPMSQSRFLDRFRFFEGEPHQVSGASMLFDAISQGVPAEQVLDEDAPWARRYSQPNTSKSVDRALPLIQLFEGRELKAYPDPGTKGDPWTIGWGSTRMPDGRPVRKGDTVTAAQADQMLRTWVEQDEAALAKAIPNWAKLTTDQQAALLSFTYNAGRDWYGPSNGYATLSAKLAEGKLSEVPRAMLLYVNPGSDVEEGLRNRRMAEGDLWGRPPQAQKPRLLLTRTRQIDGRGLELLRLQRMHGSVSKGDLLTVSGQARNQVFRTGASSKSGSMEPIPEGLWRVENIAWAGGKDNYNASWGEGLGPASVPLTWLGPGKTGRSAIEAHLDSNQNVFPGTAGCIGFRSLADLQTFIGWLRADDPRELTVDWGLGTVPKRP